MTPFIQPEASRPERARLLIADGYDVYRLGVRSILERVPGLEVVAEATNGAEAVELCRQIEPDLVLLEPRLSGLNGLTATRMITDECPSTRVLLISMNASPRDMVQAAKAGAVGYVLKDTTDRHLIECVNRVLDGETLFPVKHETESPRQLVGSAIDS